MLHLIYRCFDIYILCLTCVGIFIAYRELGQISEMMLGYSLTLENICDRWSGRINVLVEKASEEADLWPSATWYAKSLTIGFEASSLYTRSYINVPLTYLWHVGDILYTADIYSFTRHQPSVPVRIGAKSNLDSLQHRTCLQFIFMCLWERTSATKWRGCPPFVVTADLKMFLWMRASCPLVSKLIDLPNSSTV